MINAPASAGRHLTLVLGKKINRTKYPAHIKANDAGTIVLSGMLHFGETRSQGQCGDQQQGNYKSDAEVVGKLAQVAAALCHTPAMVEGVFYKVPNRLMWVRIKVIAPTKPGPTDLHVADKTK